MEKTKLDLFKSASALALETVTETNPHSIATAALARFNTEKHHAADYQFWHDTFHELRSKYQSLATQKAPSAIAAATAKK